MAICLDEGVLGKIVEVMITFKASRRLIALATTRFARTGCRSEILISNLLLGEEIAPASMAQSRRLV